MRCSPRIAVLLALLTHISCRAPERMPADDSAALSAATEGHVDVDGGVQIFYRLVGSGPDTTIVIHGGPGLSMDYFADDLAPLAARHTLVFYDQRGTGRSSLVSDSVALDAQRFVDDLEALRRHFGLERVSLLGHSWGAAIVALYAMRFPERLERFVILDGVPTTRSELVTTFQQLEASRDTTELREMQRWRQARLADPGDAAACRAYYVLMVPSIFC
jgi:proline iminopeptidase